MDNERFNDKALEDLKELIQNAQELEEETNAYCEFMKGLILNTYSVN